jgi:hypothetical protein
MVVIMFEFDVCSSFVVRIIAVEEHVMTGTEKKKNDVFFISHFQKSITMILSVTNDTSPNISR